MVLHGKLNASVYPGILSRAGLEYSGGGGGGEGLPYETDGDACRLA